MAADMLGRPSVKFGDDTSDDGSGGGIDLSGIMGTIGQGMAVAQQVGNVAVQGIAAANAIQHIVNTPPHVVAHQMIGQAMAMQPRPAPPPPPMSRQMPGAGPLGVGGAPGPAPGMQVAPAQKSWLWPLLGVGIGGMMGAGIGWLIAHNVIGAVAGGVVVGGMGGGGGYLFNRFHVDATMALNTKAGSIGLSVAKA
jgi:hypothetical protein